MKPSVVRRVLTGGALSLSLALVPSRNALAQDCIQPSLSIPGLPAPPVWLPPAGGGAYRPTLLDPRWAGAPQRHFPFSLGGPTGSLDEASVRLMRHGNTLFVAFYARVDDTWNTQDYADAVTLGFTLGTNNAAYVVSIVPDWETPPVAAPPAGTPRDPVLPAPVAPLFVRWFHTPDATLGSPAWTEQSSGSVVPPWLLEAATWRNSPGVKWAVTFKINLAHPTLNIKTAMKMFWGMQVHYVVGAGDADDLMALYGSSLPRTTADTNKVLDTIVPNRSNDWTQMAKVGTACASGITVDSEDVGIWNGSELTSEICASGPECTGRNQFRAVVRNVPMGALPEFAVRARFRTADWGSTIADLANAPWRDIPAVYPAGPNLFTATVAQLKNNGWSWTYSCDDGVATIDYLCRLVGTDAYCPKLMNGADTQHAVLVELGQPAGSTHVIARPSAYRTMDYTGLSTVTRPATISLAGLSVSTGEARDRDVYLYVDQNLPPHGDDFVEVKSQSLALARSLAEQPLTVAPSPPPPPLAAPKIEGPPPAASAAGKRALQVKAPEASSPAAEDGALVLPEESPVARFLEKAKPLSPRLDAASVLSMEREQILDEVWPTHRVRVFYDTGKTITVKDAKGVAHTSKVLQPMLPFGFHLWHDGPLYGYTHQLRLENGEPLESLAPGWHRVRVPSEGKVRIVQTITAEEKPKGAGPAPGPQDCPRCPVEKGTHCHCQLGATRSPASTLLLGGALAAAFAARRRRNRT